MTRKYPLDPLRRVREENVDREVRALSESLRQVEAARDQAEKAEQRKRDLERTLAATAAMEQQRLTRGELTAADLARGAAWTLASDIDRAAHARVVEETRSGHLEAEARSAERKRDLAIAQTSAELVAKHHERWKQQQTAASEARDEEDAEQVHLSALGRRGVP